MHTRTLRGQGAAGERCVICGAAVVVGRIHCSSCGECYALDDPPPRPDVVTNSIDEASIESFPASDPPGW